MFLSFIKNRFSYWIRWISFDCVDGTQLVTPDCISRILKQILVHYHQCQGVEIKRLNGKIKLKPFFGWVRTRGHVCDA